MKTNQNASTLVENRRVINITQMMKALSRFQDNLKKLELESNGNNTDGLINCVCHEKGHKATLDLAGKGFNMSITLSLPESMKGGKS